MRIVVALGGNALLKRGEPLTAAAQRRNVLQAVRSLAEIVDGNEVVVTHGNGPQIGLLALQSEAFSSVEPYPLDILGAETQGMIGYLIEEELRDCLGSGMEVTTLLTQVVVDPLDPAFKSPTKPVGPVYTQSKAKRLATEFGWSVAMDGDRWRRVVPSPEPLRILEINSIRLLLQAGVVVICSGGGGVPMVPDETGGLRGVEAVIDKDLSAALLALSLDDDVLLMLTDVDAVYRDWPEPMSRPIHTATPAELRAMDFPIGSMGPKVEAACRFAESVRSHGSTRFACIGALNDVGALLRQDTGTRVQASFKEP